MENSTKRILCIEDDEDTCELISYVFEQLGYQIEACSLKDCLPLIREKRFHAIILDNNFHGLSGTEICHEIRSINQHVPIVFLTGEARPAEKEKALAAGADAYLIKPNDFEQLTQTVINLIEKTSPVL